MHKYMHQNIKIYIKNKRYALKKLMQIKYLFKKLIL